MQSTAVTGTKLHVQRPRHSANVSRRLHVCACRCEPVQPPAAPQDPDAVKHVFRAIAIAAAVYAGASTAPAHAWDHGWKPRRHHRRMTDSRSGKFDVEAMLQEARIAERVQHGKEQVHQHAASTFHGLEDLAHDLRSSMRQALHSQPREMHMSESAMPRPAATPGSVKAMRGGLGWLALLAAAAAVAWLLFGKALSAWMQSWGRGGRGGGKWVRDRSLGGKMVWVADDSTAYQAYKAENPRNRPQTARRRDKHPAAAAAFVAAQQDTETGWESPTTRQAGTSEGGQQRGPPAWWDPPPSIHVDTKYQQQITQQAKAILKQMEDSKLLSGQDYSVSALVSLRQTCSESGVSVKAQTSSGRDAIFRAGVEAAAGAAMQGGQLGGASAPRFVSGLAQDLGLEAEKAGNMAVAVVAARLRAILVDAAACQRQGNELEVLDQLARVVGILDKFPLPPRSPQADMIATAVQQRATLQERQALFFTYGGMEPKTAAVMAEMLGFNPTLVMPQLHQELRR